MSWFLRIVEEVLKSAWCLVPWTFSLSKRKKGKRETNLKKGEKSKTKANEIVWHYSIACLLLSLNSFLACDMCKGICLKI